VAAPLCSLFHLGKFHALLSKVWKRKALKFIPHFLPEEFLQSFGQDERRHLLETGQFGVSALCSAARVVTYGFSCHS